MRYESNRDKLKRIGEFFGVRYKIEHAYDFKQGKNVWRLVIFFKRRDPTVVGVPGDIDIDLKDLSIYIDRYLYGPKT